MVNSFLINDKYYNIITIMNLLCNKTFNFKYIENNTFDNRLIESVKIRTKFPNRFPVICEVNNTIDTTMRLSKNKFLVPGNLTVGQFIYVVRKYLAVNSIQTVFVFTESNEIPKTSECIDSLYNLYKNKDGYLYLSINVENTFG